MLRLIPIFRVFARSVCIRSDYSASVAPIGHVPFVKDKKTHSLRERGAEHSVAVQDSYAGLEHGNVAVEVFCPEPLAPQFGEIFYSLREAQILIEQWRKHYNTKRPHSALGYRPPAPETIVQMDQRPIMH